MERSIEDAADTIYLLGDVHTVTCFSLMGIEGMVTDNTNILTNLGSLVRQKDSIIILVTRQLASIIREEIRLINLNSARPVIIEIPGVDDEFGLEGSMIGYVTEALGISI
ncbi:MAG: hypothetical protein GY754_00585 [bacterium]|nr:hypothetical protein [bacterium]